MPPIWRWIIGPIVGGAALLWVAASFSPRHTRAGSDTVALDLGPYHIEIPAAFSPEIGIPGDPRRSRYVFMIIPVERLGLKAPSNLAMHPVANVVASLHLDGSDAERLARYADVPKVSPPEFYQGYIGHRLQSAGNLYVATDHLTPPYLACPWYASHPGGNYPMICDADETVLSVGHGVQDLTVEYSIRQDYWPELAQISMGLKSLMKSLVVVRINGIQ